MSRGAERARGRERGHQLAANTAKSRSFRARWETRVVFVYSQPPVLEQFYFVQKYI